MSTTFPSTGRWTSFIYEAMKMGCVSSGGVEALSQSFERFLEVKGLRFTEPRKAIFAGTVALRGHYTAEELLEAVRGIDSRVSRATVYRTLPILMESGIVREVDVGRDHKYYMTVQAGKNFQAQIICEDCEKIFEIDAPFMDWYGTSAAKKLGLHVSSYRLQVYATCDELRVKGMCHKPQPCSLMDLR